MIGSNSRLHKSNQKSVGGVGVLDYYLITDGKG